MALGNEELLVRIRGIDGLSAPAQKAQQSLRNLGNQARKSQIQMNQFGGALTGTGKNMRKFALGGLQQAGYQIGDFAVQVANGTSRMQAFGQQAPQLLQIFGPLGAIAGAAVAVFAAFGVAAEKSAGSSEKMTSKLKRLNEELQFFSDIASMELQASMSDAADVVLRKWQPILDLIKSANAEQLAKDLSAFKISLLPDDIDDQKAALQDIVQKSYAATSNQEDLNASRIKAQNQLSNIAALEGVIGQLSGKTKEELQESFLTTVNRLKFLKLMTPELAKQLAEFAQQQDIQSDISAMMLDEIRVQGDRLKNISGITSEMAFEDAIMGEIVGKNQTSLDLEAKRRKEHEPLKETLKREDELFSMAVTKNAQSLALEQQRLSVHEAMVRARLKTQFSEEDKLMGLAVEADQAVINRIKSDLEKAQRPAKALTKVIKQELSPEMKRAADLGNSIGQSFENAMISAVDGTMSVKDAFRSMSADIIKELYRVFFVKRITGFIADMVSFAAGPRTGNTGTLGLPSFAGGGYTGGGSRSGGVDGKGGFNAILHPNETVIDHTKGQGGQIVVNQTINVSTGVQQTVRTEIKSLMPQIAESAKAAVADAKRRGGSYGRAFA